MPKLMSRRLKTTSRAPLRERRPIDDDVSRSIWQQIGGKKFQAMTGAKNLVSGDKFLQFNLPIFGSNRFSKVRITLEPTDTYTVRFMRINNRTLQVVKERTYTDVYSDNLRAVFTEATGLDTTL